MFIFEFGTLQMRRDEPHTNKHHCRPDRMCHRIRCIWYVKTSKSQTEVLREFRKYFTESLRKVNIIAPSFRDLSSQRAPLMPTKMCSHGSVRAQQSFVSFTWQSRCLHYAQCVISISSMSKTSRSNCIAVFSTMANSSRRVSKQK